MNHFDRPDTMSVEAYDRWYSSIKLLIVMTLAIEKDKRTGVGQAQYKMHTTRSPNVKRAAHE